MNNTESDIRKQVAHEEVSRRAEELWRQYGCPEARDEEIWLEAERQLRGTPLDTPSASESVHFPGSNLAAPASASTLTPPSNTELMQAKPANRSSKARSKSSGK